MKREKEIEIGIEAEKRGGFQWEVWEFESPWTQVETVLCPSNITPYLHHLSIWGADKVKSHKIWDSWAGAWASLWPLLMLCLTASHALNSSLTFIAQACFCVCVCVCAGESERLESKTCMPVVPLGIYYRSQQYIDFWRQTRATVFFCIIIYDDGYYFSTN